jgi:hypothetical protein
LLEPSNQERDDGKYIEREVTDQVPTAQEAPVPENYTLPKLFDYISTTDCCCYYYYYYHHHHFCYWKYKIQLSNGP